MSKPVTVPEPPEYSPLLDEDHIVPVINYIEHWANLQPDRIALVADHTYSYQQLDRQSNQAANGLVNRLNGSNRAVAVLFDKNSQAVISTVGVLKSGNFYAGLDPGQPEDYLHSVCEDLAPAAILTSQKHSNMARRIGGGSTQVLLIEQLLEDEPPDPPESTITLDNTAGIYFTSGSTGRSKGVMVDHRALWYRTYSSVLTLKFNPADRTCVPFPVGFGWSTTPLFGTLVSGGRVYLYDFAEKPVAEAAEWLIDHRITNTPMPAVFFRQFLAGLPDGFTNTFPDMRLLFAGGDSLETDSIKLWQQRFPPACLLAYGFSSTEAGPITRTFVSTDTTVSDNTLKFGVPAVGVDVLILDDYHKPAPAGTVGEIAIRSKGVMSGYWNRPDLNNEKFTPDPLEPGGRLLLTGDLGLLDDKCQLEFYGRKDRQVKVRGFLVNLAHTEALIRGLESIQDAAVVPVHRKKGETRLAAYLVLRPPAKMSIRALRGEMQEKLPNYLIPQYLFKMDDLPRNASGKVNSLLLPSPLDERLPLDTEYVPPRSGMEQEIAAIWREILGVGQIGIDDNFFDLGGDSLSALEMAAHVESDFGKTLPQSFFTDPTITHLSRLIESPQKSHGTDNNRFTLQSSQQGAGKRTEQPQNRLRSLITRILRGNLARRLEIAADRLTAWQIARMPYLQARRWIVSLSQTRAARNLLYSRRYGLFEQWLDEMETSAAESKELFKASIVTNLNYGIRRYKKMKSADNQIETQVLAEFEAMRSSPSKYWSSLAELILSTPQEKFSQLFPINGLNYLSDAVEHNNGVVMVSFHGMTPPLRFLPLKRILGQDIFTLTYHIPLSQSSFDNAPADVPAEMSAAMNAELALFAQRLIQSGGVVNIIGDSKSPFGVSHQITIGKRGYQIKTGFAEIAVNTGAVVLPYFGRCLPDGRPETNILPPFIYDPEDRNRAVHDLIDQYETFINSVWREYPTAVRWVRIEDHFSLPVVI